MARQADAILKEIIGQLSIQFAVAQAGLEAANEEIGNLRAHIVKVEADLNTLREITHDAA